MVPTPPKLIFEASVNPKPFRRRFAWSALATVTAVGALIALDRAGAQTNLDPRVLLVGQAVALVAVVLMFIRTVQNLWHGLVRKPETLRFYDKGFVWKRTDKEYKYGWSQLQSYRDNTRVISLGQKPLLQFGAYTLRMQDGEKFKFTGAQGDVNAFAKAVRRYVSYATGVHLSRALRREEVVSLHPRLQVQPDGVISGKEGVHWADMNVMLRGHSLILQRRGESGKLQHIRRYDTGKVDNVGGFMEVAVSAIRDHQPERFRKRE
jgi:hypothetical protein